MTGIFTDVSPFWNSVYMSQYKLSTNISNKLWIAIASSSAPRPTLSLVRTSSLSLSFTTFTLSVLKLRVSALELLKCSPSYGHVTSPLPLLMQLKLVFPPFPTCLLSLLLPQLNRDRVHLALTTLKVEFTWSSACLCIQHIILHHSSHVIPSLFYNFLLSIVLEHLSMTSLSTHLCGAYLPLSTRPAWPSMDFTLLDEAAIHASHLQPCLLHPVMEMWPPLHRWDPVQTRQPSYRAPMHWPQCRFWDSSCIFHLSYPFPCQHACSWLSSLSQWGQTQIRRTAFCVAHNPMAWSLFVSVSGQPLSMLFTRSYQSTQNLSSFFHLHSFLLQRLVT